MNLGDLRTAWNDFLLQSSTSNIAAATEGNRYLNEAQRRLHQRIAAKHLNFFRASTDLNEVSGSAVITLPTDLYRIVRMERIKGRAASATNPSPMSRVGDNNDALWHARNTWRGSYSVAYPLTYTVEGQARIRLVTAPTVTQTGSIRLYYSFKPADMASDTDVPFQQTAGTGGSGTDDLVEFHDLIWMFAAQKVLVKEQSTQVYSMLSDQVNQRLSELQDYLSAVDEGPRWVNPSISDEEFFDN